jgi:hypothetical protein
MDSILTKQEIETTGYADVCVCGHIRGYHLDYANNGYGCEDCNCIAFRLEEARLLR